jgi:hypothetical protein
MLIEHPPYLGVFEIIAPEHILDADRTCTELLHDLWLQGISQAFQRVLAQRVVLP